MIALPGVRVEDVQVQLTAAGLQVDAAVAPQALGAGMNILRMEIPYGRMRRRIELPPGRYALSERSLNHGYLQLHLTREIV